MKRTLAVGFAASALLVGPTVSAQAADGHPKATKAEKKEQRRHDAREARRAAHKPVQDTTTTPPATGASGSQSRAGTPGKALGKATKTQGVVSCTVQADRAGGSFLIHNGCDTPQTITVSVQSQPGPWHKGLCAETKTCVLLNRHDITVPPGTSTITAGSSACYFQVDLKWRGELIKSNHFVTDCTPPKPPVVTPKPKPPVVHNPVTHSHIDSHKRPKATPATELAYTGAGDTGKALGTVGGLLGVGALLVAAGRKPKDAK